MKAFESTISTEIYDRSLEIHLYCYSVMEITGLAVGVAGLAGLFSACIVVLERVDSYENLGFESRNVTARFEADKVLFNRWAKDVGISDNKLMSSHHVGLDDVATAKVVVGILSSIREVFSHTDGTTWLGIGNQYNDGQIIPEKLTIEATASEDTRSKSPARRFDRVKWSQVGKTRFIAQVEAFGGLIEKLYALVPPQGISGYLESHEHHLNRACLAKVTIRVQQLTYSWNHNRISDKF